MTVLTIYNDFYPNGHDNNNNNNNNNSSEGVTNNVMQEFGIIIL
jgi:hypothetical protein